MLWANTVIIYLYIAGEVFSAFPLHVQHLSTHVDSLQWW